MVARFLKRLVGYGIRKAKMLGYRKFRPGHIFPVQVNEIRFKMIFKDYTLDVAIIERIHGRREPETTAIIESLLRDGDKVLELGACYGYFTLIMSNCVGAKGKIVSVEGTPNTFEILKENLHLNGVKNVDAYNFFITTRTDKVYYDAGDKHPYDAIKRLDKQKQLNKQTSIPVPVRKLSSFLAEIDFNPDYIFMDIEGFEVEVFDDLSERYLQSRRPIFVFEIHPTFYKGERDLSFILSILNKCSYAHRKIADNLICFPQQNIRAEMSDCKAYSQS